MSAWRRQKGERARQANTPLMLTRDSISVFPVNAISYDIAVVARSGRLNSTNPAKIAAIPPT
jgi:hypothetical protein